MGRCHHLLIILPCRGSHQAEIKVLARLQYHLRFKDLSEFIFGDRNQLLVIGLKLQLTYILLTRNDTYFLGGHPQDLATWSFSLAVHSMAVSFFKARWSISLLYWITSTSKIPPFLISLKGLPEQVRLLRIISLLINLKSAD